VSGHAPRAAAWLLLAAAAPSFAESPPASGKDAGWFESGDAQLRIDLQLLNDAEVIRYPVNQWPIPRAAIRYALAQAKDHHARNRRWNACARAPASATECDSRRPCAAAKPACCATSTA
jgi:hypothetical protein